MMKLLFPIVQLLIGILCVNGEVQGWRPEVRARLEKIINEGAGCKHPIVFDLDETILARDIADATLAVLVRDGIITKESVPAYLCPTFRLGDRLISLEGSVDLVEYGNYLQQSTAHQKDDLAPNICFYAWVAQILSGLTCQQVVEATAKAYYSSSSNHKESYIPITPGKTKCPVPFIRPEMVELIGAFLQRDYDVWVVSASPVLIARWVILEVLNPKLKEMGSFRTIPAGNVIGISTLLQDDTQNLYKDYPLLNFDHGYERLEHASLSRYRLTPHLTPPITGYSGKVAAIIDRIGIFPYFGAGDSLSDHPFLKLCTHKLWMARVETPDLQLKAFSSMSENQDGSWMIQPVLSKKNPCLLQNLKLPDAHLFDFDEIQKIEASFKILNLIN